jgi:hypothetical protein
MVKIKTPKGTFDYELSDKKDKKLKVMVNGKYIYFGAPNYEHFFDKTKLLNPKLNHLDPLRRNNYRKRASKIVDKEGNLTVSDINSANYHAYNILW